MRTKLSYWAFLLIIFVACKGNDSRPKDILDEKTMVSILTDIHLIEAKVSRMQSSDFDSTKVAYKELERRVLVKNNTDTANYRKSYNYYVTKPDQMTAIYEQTIKNLEALKKTKK